MVGRTGASGYIGGDLLSVLAAQYPDCRYRLLCRSPASGEKIKSLFPLVDIVQGSLDELDTLAAESARADIIIRE